MPNADAETDAVDALVFQRIEALAALENELTEAVQSSSHNGSGREAAGKALAAIYRFLCAAKVPSELRVPIIELAGALDALNVGKVLPLVAPQATAGRPPLTEGEWIPRAIAAAALEVRYRELKKSGEEKSLPKAASWVARKIRDRPGFESSKPSPGRILDWRSALMEEPNSPLANLYGFLITRYSTAEELLAKEIGEWKSQ